LVFERFNLPNIRKLMENGIYGELESTIPAITCPAWMSMMTSKNPGKLGFYGFRNRANYSYDEMIIANAKLVKEDTVWRILTRHGKKSIIIGVPQTYPPKPLNGYMITSFLTPDTNSRYTYPASLKDEIKEVVGDYMLDVEEFRTENKDYLLQQIYEMTEKRFKVATHLMNTKEWDFFMMVEMGPDRIHHGFWKFFDEQHRKYESGSKYVSAIEDYFKYLDEKIGELLSNVDDDTTVIVVSDHGIKRMEGGICVNEWFIREGYLTLKETPKQVRPLRTADIDWDRTKAWGSGGYYARIFLNVKGREPNGIIEQEDYENIRDELKEKLEALGDENGKPIGTRVFKPQDIYPVINNIPPDLIVYFGDLDWRSVGSIGLNTTTVAKQRGEAVVHTFENDTGPDDANHSQYGIFIMKNRFASPLRSERDQHINNPGKVDGLHIMDVAPTVLDISGVEAPEDMEGKVIR